MTITNAFWSGDKSRRIEQRIVVEGDLVLETPALFGNGDSDALTDMPLLVDDYDTVSPLLTGATLAGALRAYLWARENDYRTADPDPSDKPEHQKSLTEILFGGFKGHDEGKQSPLIVDDALGKKYGIQLRDGVRLNPKSRTAEDKGLFDMQVWQKGTTFPIRLELLVTRPRQLSDDDVDIYQKKLKLALLMALQGLTDDTITLGARKNRGFGRITVKNWRVRQYDLKTTAGLTAWLTNGSHPFSELMAVNSPFAGYELEDLPDARSYFRLEATFKLDGSLLIRANGQPQSKSPDMVHLSYDEETPILPGTSVTGALRQRARRILSIVNQGKVDDWLNDLFGAEKMDNKATASRLIVEETIIEDPQFDLVQNRVAIDRFTGGALESALFNEQPVFGKPDTCLHVNLTIRKPTEQDIGLVLLLLKDLWTGDLPLGGEISVGRGRLRGHCAKLIHQPKDSTLSEWVFKEVNEKLIFDKGRPEDLEKFVRVLNGGAA